MRRRGTDALLAAAVLSQRELFARLLVDPREARAAHRRLCMPGDAFPTAATRHACPRRSSNRPACADKRCLRQLRVLLEGGGGVTRRQPGVGLAGGGFGAEPEPWRAAAAACFAATLTRCLRQWCFRIASCLLACCWTRGRLGRLAGGSACPGDALRLRRRGTHAHAAARTGRPVPTGAASTSAAAGGRRRRDKTPAWGWPSWRRLRRGAGALEGGGFGAEPWWAAAAECAAAARALCSAAAGPDGASGDSPAGDHARASVCGGCGGAALVPTLQLAEAGLCSQARLRRCCCVERRHGATLAGAWPGRRHPCPDEPLRLRRRGTLARGAARIGRPVCTDAASTSAAARRRRRHDKMSAWGLAQQLAKSARSRSRSLGVRWRLLAPSHG